MKNSCLIFLTLFIFFQFSCKRRSQIELKTIRELTILNNAFSCYNGYKTKQISDEKIDLIIRQLERLKKPLKMNATNDNYGYLEIFCSNRTVFSVIFLKSKKNPIIYFRGDYYENSHLVNVVIEELRMSLKKHHPDYCISI